MRDLRVGSPNIREDLEWSPRSTESLGYPSPVRTGGLSETPPEGRRHVGAAPDGTTNGATLEDPVTTGVSGLTQSVHITDVVGRAGVRGPAMPPRAACCTPTMPGNAAAYCALLLPRVGGAAT